MTCDSLRDFLAILDQNGQVLRIGDEVSPRTRSGNRRKGAVWQHYKQGKTREKICNVICAASYYVGGSLWLSNTARITAS